MGRLDKWGDETLHGAYCRVIWESEKTSVQDKDWVDKISIKNSIKMSEQERLERLYEQAKGSRKAYPGW